MRIETENVFEFANICANIGELYEFARKSNIDDKEVNEILPDKCLSVRFCLNADKVDAVEFKKQMCDVKTQERISVNFAETCSFVNENLYGVFVTENDEYAELVGVASDMEDFYYVYNVLDKGYSSETEINFKTTGNVIYVSAVGFQRPFECEQIIYITE